MVHGVLQLIVGDLGQEPQVVDAAPLLESRRQKRLRLRGASARSSRAPPVLLMLAELLR